MRIGIGKQLELLGGEQCFTAKRHSANFGLPECKNANHMGRRFCLMHLVAVAHSNLMFSLLLLNNNFKLDFMDTANKTADQFVVGTVARIIQMNSHRARYQHRATTGMIGAAWHNIRFA